MQRDEISGSDASGDGASQPGRGDVALAAVDAAVERSVALWVDQVTEAARWPDRGDFDSADAYHANKDRFDEFLVGREAREIARILFQLTAYRIGSVPAMEALIERHNDAILRDLADPEYVRSSGINPERMRQALFASDSEKEVLLNAVSRYGPGVLHKSAYGRLLVRHANVNRVNATLDVLRDAGFLTIRKGANNADIIKSDGRLEAAHRAYIARIVETVTEEGLL
ncbi:MAG: hypothetical protein AAF899_12995 [Pseudomonadota bacterium]